MPRKPADEIADSCLVSWSLASFTGACRGRIVSGVPGRGGSGREVKQRSGNEVGGFEDLEVALGAVVSFGAVDDGLGHFVPGDFLEGVA